jgi:hypothetical protein
VPGELLISDTKIYVSVYTNWGLWRKWNDFENSLHKILIKGGGEEGLGA